MDLHLYLKRQAQVVDAALAQYLPSDDAYPFPLHAAMRYSVFAGGKRLRPILVLAAAEVVGGDAAVAIPAACAMEFIHTYSLIHDDLPAMDDDDYRRGKLTNHKVFGEAVAILAGDALLTRAFAVAAESSPRVGPARTVEVLREIADAAGSTGLVGGQVMDIMSEGKTITPAVLEYIHTHKTGTMLRASVRVGAILGGADSLQLRQLTDYGEKIGLCYQIVDDILDATGDAVKLGKGVRKDAARQKNTYPTLFGLAAAESLAAELAAGAKASLAELPGDAAVLQALADLIVKREN